ncbi:MAG: calcium/sodium antiporter [Oscillospiraceae bacterium]|nr:calcium/sodium antiporter [Oscillospiraceae bacterium]
MLIPVLLFLVGLACLIKGGDWFVDSAVGIAHRFHMPELLIGATVVSIGTTLPEVMVSAQAALEHNSGISYGNAIGSVICNTSLIAALTIAIRPSGVDKKTLRFPVAAFFLSAGIYAGIAYTTGRFQRIHGLLFLAMFVAYIIINIIQMKRSPEADAVQEEAEEAEKPMWKDIVLLVIGAVLIAVGAKLLVDNGTLIAEALGVPSSVIGLTMVALGTSLPELVTAITSLIKGHSSLSLGNIIGANIFNLILVSGTAITIYPFAIPVEKTIRGMNASLVVDIPVMLFVMAVLTLPPLAKGKLSRWQGILLLCVYVAFTAFQFIH